MSAVRTVALATHSHPEQTADAVRAAAQAAEAAGVELLVSDDELGKHPEAAAGLGRVE
ncbi:MAG: hypothetical protein ACR2OC_10495 [Solirubrobacterales bacterium]